MNCRHHLICYWSPFRNTSYGFFVKSKVDESVEFGPILKAAKAAFALCPHMPLSEVSVFDVYINSPHQGHLYSSVYSGPSAGSDVVFFALFPELRNAAEQAAQNYRSISKVASIMVLSLWEVTSDQMPDGWVLVPFNEIMEGLSSSCTLPESNVRLMPAA